MSMRKIMIHYAALMMLAITGGAWVTPAFSNVRVLACEPEWKALAEEIGGEYVVATSATTALQDPHLIEARPSLIAQARRADLLFCTGAELEIGWLPLLLRQSGNKEIQVGRPGHLMAADQVTTIEVPEKLDRSMGDIHAAGNPHIHLDPYRILLIANALTERLSHIDPDNHDAYQQQLKAFTQEWNASIRQWETLAKPLQGAKVVIHHRNLNYLFNWLGISTIADLEPKPGLPPTSSHLASVLNDVKQKRPNLITLAQYHNDRGARWLSKRAKVPIVKLPYTVGGTPDVTSLHALFDISIKQLLHAVGGHQ